MATIPFIYNNPNNCDAEGIFLALLGNRNAGERGSFDVSGFRLAGLFNTSSDFSGVEIAAFNYSEGLTGISTGALNMSEKNKGFALQLGAVNIINNYDEEGTVIQIGLYNRAGERSSPFFNIKRKKKSLEGKTDST